VSRLRTVHGQLGIALIGALLLLLVMSALAVGAIYLVNNEKQISGADLESNTAYYAAEAGMEKMISDLASLYTLRQSPTVADVQTLGNFPPALPNFTYPEYQFVVPNNSGIPISERRNISSGPNAGLIAQIIPMTLNVTAQRPTEAQVRMSRSIEVALIPVFQFGVFCDNDCSYFAGPNFDFAGRVHTNGNLFLASSSTLTFHDKVTAVGEVVRAELANGVSTVSTGRTGNVRIPTAPSGCDGSASSCRDLQENEGSKVAGPLSANNTSWTSLSVSSYNGLVLNGRTGAKPLQLPFVTAGVGPIEIIRRPPPGESPVSAVGQSRLFNLSQIRVLLANTAAELPGGAGDAQNIALDNVGIYATGVPVAGANPTYFATADVARDGDWVRPTGFGGAQWPLLNGFLRVEVLHTDGTYSAVTREWLELGFARGLVAPTTGVANGVHPNAILILQQQADRNGNGSLADAGESAVVTGAAAKSNWFPLNLYDTREGEVRDNSLGAASTSCAVGGVMNVVEVDVNNLKRWLAGTIGATGNQVESASQNGYILYFSDRRGTLVASGEYGYEDVANPADSAGTPNGALDPGEDSSGNGLLETAGAGNLGTGFALANGNPYLRMANCTTLGRKNRVTGARHAIKVINGGLGNLPTRPDGTGGFTVASEQPVYLQGDYNANAGGWTAAHAAAAVISDSVTLLSNNWTDYQSFRYPTYQSNVARRATQSYYRFATAAGKSLTFQRPAWGAYEDFGTDGGVHNFLRYLEDWSGVGANYKGSLVSFYYSQYATGTFKCCNTVYSAPTRNYSFDTDFLDPAKLPPGTPHFRDIVNVGFKQDFKAY
jgi:hypothetical protein